jgi:2-keto-4-pentenoate hydratase/2-oxohepta-3-ene-1,7-dioic acid hydratase in catechol pathway
MRYLSFEHKGRAGWGAIKNDGVIDLSGCFPTLRDAIAGCAWNEVDRIVGAAKIDFPLSGLRYLPPIPQPEKIMCVGMNYASRRQQYEDYLTTFEAPKYPSLFIRTTGSLVGHEQPIIRPLESRELDYEGEIVLVIGKGGRRISQARAWEHVFGISAMNEGTVRDWARHSKINITQGKNFSASGSWGPWIVTADEVDRNLPLSVETTVNGEVRQKDTTSHLIFTFEYLVSYISTFTELKPGDLIATGTPAGGGAGFEPVKWLVPGDSVAVTVSGVGTLLNPVRDE